MKTPQQSSVSVQLLEATPILQRLEQLENTIFKIVEQLYQPTPEPSEKLLTRKEVCNLLQCSVVTLHNWNKKGVLKPYRIGNGVRYKHSEVMQKFERGQN